LALSNEDANQLQATMPALAQTYVSFGGATEGYRPSGAQRRFGLSAAFAG
jgi:hypothetical protein